MSMVASDGTTEVIMLERDPAQGGELVVSGVPIAKIEQLYGPTAARSPVSLMQQMEYCKLVTETSRQETLADSSNPSMELRQTSASEPRQRMSVAGRIVSVDEEGIVLENAFMIDESAPARTGTPMASKVHHRSRLFKNTGVALQQTPIPGQLRIPVREVRHVESISAASWPSFQENGYQRIGIDFDFAMSSTP